MYIYPSALPPFSNREDLYLTVSLFDDDLGTAIGLSGTTLANPGAAFTSNAWTVIDGAIITNSATPITIPTFPIGNQLAALALTVGLNLGILAGDPITIQDTATGLNQMTGYVLSYNPATGALVVQIGMTFEFEIRRKRTNNGGSNYAGDGYSLSGGMIGYYDESAPIITAQLGNGISIVDVGFILIMIPVAIFGKLHAMSYLASLTMTDSQNTRQVFVADLPVIYGGVSRNPAANPTNAAWEAIF
jgi:hypothetical protein